MRKTIHYIDMFAGMGGFREGLTRAGDFVCMGHCEIDKYADRSYRALFDTEGEWFIDDARKADPETMPDFELLCGGFPCQAFSLAGNRRGPQDERIYSPEGVSCTLAAQAGGGGGRVGLPIKEATRKGYKMAYEGDKQTRESKGLLFVFAMGKSMDGLRGYRSGRFGFQTPTSAWLFADSHGFLFVGGLLAGWTFSPHLAAATE